MYISNTTQEQRRIIDSALDGMYFKVRRAHNLLGRVWDDYFERRIRKLFRAPRLSILGS